MKVYILTEIDPEYYGSRVQVFRSKLKAVKRFKQRLQELKEDAEEDNRCVEKIGTYKYNIESYGQVGPGRHFNDENPLTLTLETKTVR